MARTLPLLLLLLQAATASYTGGGGLVGAVHAVRMICEPPEASLPVQSQAKRVNVDDAAIKVNELPALRTAEAQAMLEGVYAAAAAQERAVSSDLAAAVETATKLQMTMDNLRRRLNNARRALVEAQEAVEELYEEEPDVKAVEEEEEKHSGGFWIFGRRKRREEAVKRAVEDRAKWEARMEVANALVTRRRHGLDVAFNNLELGREKADPATAIVEDISARAADATALADNAHREAVAKERVIEGTREDLVAVVASAGMLAESLGLGALSALGLDSSAERSRDLGAERHARDQLRQASRIIDCLEDDHLGVLDARDADAHTLKEAFQALVELLNADATAALPPEEAAVCSEAFGRVVSSYAHLSGGGTWAAQESLTELGLQAERKSVYDYIPPAA